MSLEVSSLRATAHPSRLRMLSLLTGAAMSAAELARELDLTQANASYHLRILAAAGLVEDAGEEQIRGGVAKRYRYPVSRPGARIGHDAESRFLTWQAMASELIRRAGQQTDGEQHLCDAEVWVPAQVWAEAIGLVAKAGALLHDHARPPRSPDAVHVNATMALFAMDGER